MGLAFDHIAKEHIITVQPPDEAMSAKMRSLANIWYNAKDST